MEDLRHFILVCFPLFVLSTCTDSGTASPPSQWSFHSLDSDHVNALIVDQHSVYASLFAGGVLRWEGGRWRSWIDTTRIPGRITDLVRHPTQTDWILLAVSSVQQPSPGVYRTDDGGAHWQAVELSSISGPIYKLVWVGDQLVAIGQHVYVTEDFGQTWLERGSSPAGDTPLIVQYADAPENIWIGGRNAFGEGILYFSNSGGTTWERVSVPEPLDPLDYPLAIGVPPHDPLVAYVSYGAFFLRTADGGSAWEIVGGRLSADRILWSLHVDPAHPQHLWGGTKGALLETPDQGNTWTVISNPIPDSLRVYEMAYVDDTLYLGVENGIYRYVPTDAQ